MPIAYSVKDGQYSKESILLKCTDLHQFEKKYTLIKKYKRYIFYSELFLINNYSERIIIYFNESKDKS